MCTAITAKNRKSHTNVWDFFLRVFPVRRELLKSAEKRGEPASKPHGPNGRRYLFFIPDYAGMDRQENFPVYDCLSGFFGELQGKIS